MSNGTLSTQFELLSGLADNNIKAITASDVSNIVKSNFQPVMIWTGYFVRDSSTAGDNYWYPRTSYYNPDFFEPRSTGAGLLDATQFWRFTNRGNLDNNTTYLNVQVIPDAAYQTDIKFASFFPTKPATFNLYTDGTGAVDRYDIVSCGQGWWGHAGTYSGSSTTGAWTKPGQTGSIPITGKTQIPTVEFIGPFTPYSGPNSMQGADPGWDISTNSNSPTAAIPGQGASDEHNFLNTMLHATNTLGKNDSTYNPGWMIGPTTNQTQAALNPNQISAQGIQSGSNDGAQAVTLWRMPF